MKTLDIRLKAYAPNGDTLGLLPRPSSFTASFLHNDVGALQLEYSRKTINGSILERQLETGLEIAVEVTDGTTWMEPFNGRFLLISRSRDALDTSDTVTFTCPSYGWLLNKALMLNLDHLDQSGDDKGKRVFKKSSAGLIIRTFLDENKTRGGVPVTCGFDTGKDAAGVAWKSAMTLAYDPGVSVLTALANLADNKICDWVFDKRTLKIYNFDSTALCRDYSSKSIQLAYDVETAPEEESIETLASHILVQGANDKPFTQDNPAAPSPWGKWETYLSQQGITDRNTAALYMQSVLDTSARVRGQYTRTIRITNTAYLPLIDYRPGDWITAPTVRHGEKTRVQQITLSLESNQFKASLVLNDKIYDRTVRQAKRVQGILGGAINGGTGGGIPAPEKDHRIPKAPEGLTVQTDAYIDSNGIARGLASLKWAEVIKATDDTSIDISSYRVEYRKNIAGAPWLYAGVTDLLQMGIGQLECGVRYEFRVLAIPTYSDKWGLWSPVVVALVESDVTPPSIPSKPILTSKLGVVSVRWDGKNNVGAGMEADFDHCEVGMSTGNGNWTYHDRVQGDGYCHVTGLELNSTWWFALRSVDHSDNKSDWSEGASIKVAPAVTQEDLNASAEDILNKAHEDAAKQVAVTDKKVADNTAAIEANKAEQEKADAAIRADVKANADKITANKAEADKADAAIRADVKANADKITANKAEADKADAAIKADVKKNADQIIANKAEQEKADAAIKADIKKNADQIIANKTEADKADTAIRNDLKTTQDAVKKNTDANTAQQQQIDATKSALDQANKTISQHTQAIANAQKQADAAKAQAEANAGKIEQNTAGIGAIQQHQAEVDKTITQAQSDIKTATSTAQKALDKANSVGTSIDGLHNVFTGPDDPTTLDGVTVKDGDLWNKTGSYWTRWQGDPNNSPSLLADFYTYWIGEPNNSASALVPLATRVIGTFKFDSKLNMWVELSNADMDTVKQALKDNQKQLEEADKTLAQTNKDLAQAKTDLAKAKTDIDQANKDITTNRNNLAEANKDITANSNAIAQANKDITANKNGLAETNKQLAQTNKNLANAQTELDKAKTDISQAKTDISANKTGLAEANKQISQAKTDISANKTALDKAGKDIAAANKLIAGNTTAIETNRQNITNTSIVAQKALDKANSVGTSLDGLHNVYVGPDDPTGLENTTVHQGDLWYRTQKYWTRWAGTPNNSASLLADFYTYWTGEPNNSASALVPLSSRIVDASVYDGKQWNQINLVAANILATGSVVASNMAANSITTNALAANSVVADKIAAAAITAGKIAANAVNADNIVANAITTDKLAALAVTTAKLAAGAVVADKIAANAITTSKLAALAVTAEKIAAGAITADKIAANSIDASKIKANTITGDKIAGNTITAGNLAANSVTADKLAANSVDASKIVAKTITGDKIAANTITAGNLAANSVTADKIAANAVTADKIKADSVTSDKIVSNAITGDKLAANSVTAGKIAAKSINASHMTANSIISDAIAANAVTADKIKAGAITADKIAANSITSDKIKGNLLSGTTVEGGTFRTLNGRLIINDTGILLKDAKGAATLSALTADGSVTMRGALTAGSTITGTTITGSQFTTTGKHVDISDDGMVFTDADGKPVLTWAPIKYWTRWAGEPNNSASLLADFYTEWLGEPNNSPSRLTTLADKWRLVMDAPIMSSATISGSTLKGGVIEGAEYRGLKPDGTQYLTINSSGMTMGDKLAYDSAKGQLTISGTIKASTLTGSTITTTNGKLIINDSGIVLNRQNGVSPAFVADAQTGRVTVTGEIKGSLIIGSNFRTTNGHLLINDTGIVLTRADNTPTLTANAADGSISMTGMIKASTITGSAITTTNGKLTINDTGIRLNDSKGNATLTANTSDGSISMIGTIKASTITGSTFTTTNGRLTINDSGIVLKKSDGTATLTALAADGSVSMIGTIKASTVTGSTITTTNGRMLWNDTGLVLKDANGNPTLTMLTSDGSIALKGSITSGSTLSGVTITGSILQTSSDDKRGIKITSAGLVGYDIDGNAKFTLTSSGSIKMDGGVIANGMLTAPTMMAGTISSTTIDAARITGSTISGNEITGGTIVGAVIKTDKQAYRGIEIRDNNSISAYDNTGNRRIYIYGDSAYPYMDISGVTLDNHEIRTELGYNTGFQLSVDGSIVAETVKFDDGNWGFRAERFGNSSSLFGTMGVGNLGFNGMSLFDNDGAYLTIDALHAIDGPAGQTNGVGLAVSGNNPFISANTYYGHTWISVPTISKTYMERSQEQMFLGGAVNGQRRSGIFKIWDQKGLYLDDNYTLLEYTDSKYLNMKSDQVVLQFSDNIYIFLSKDGIQCRCGNKGFGWLKGQFASDLEWK